MTKPILREPHSIASVWHRFRRRFIPASAGEAEVERYRLTFYSGAWAVGAVLVMVADDQIGEHEHARLTAEMTMELVAFYEELEGSTP